jgi:hypothetical protein
MVCPVRTALDAHPRAAHRPFPGLLPGDGNGGHDMTRQREPCVVCDDDTAAG